MVVDFSVVSGVCIWLVVVFFIEVVVDSVFIVEAGVVVVVSVCTELFSVMTCEPSELFGISLS